MRITKCGVPDCNNNQHQQKSVCCLCGTSLCARHVTPIEIRVEGVLYGPERSKLDGESIDAVHANISSSWLFTIVQVCPTCYTETRDGAWNYLGCDPTKGTVVDAGKQLLRLLRVITGLQAKGKPFERESTGIIEETQAQKT